MIIEIDGQPSTSTAELLAELRDHEPGETIKLTVQRGDRQAMLEVEPGERSSSEPAPIEELDERSVATAASRHGHSTNADTSHHLARSRQ